MTLLDNKVSNGFDEYEMYYHLMIKIGTLHLRSDPKICKDQYEEVKVCLRSEHESNYFSKQKYQVEVVYLHDKFLLYMLES